VFLKNKQLFGSAPTGAFGQKKKLRLSKLLPLLMPIGLLDSESRSYEETNENATIKVGDYPPEPTQPYSSNVQQKKKKNSWFWLWFYFRLRRINAAAAATIITMAAPIAMSVVAGIPLFGGTTAALGDGEFVCDGTVGAVV
jgi:hypothetical protein